MKIGIYTDALADYVSGGIIWIVEILNQLTEWGHDCTCFVNLSPYRSDWLQTNFKILPASEIKKFDGILVSPYSPTAKVVAEAENVEDKFYAVHTNESLFIHNGKEWQDRARQSYSLPLKIFCTSTYLQILMETVFNRYVIGHLVPPGVDLKVFRPSRRVKEPPYRIGILHRADWVRGLDTAIQALDMMYQDMGPKYIKPYVFGNINNRYQMAETMREIDFYIDLSRVAGSPTPVRESMACGCIPISTKYGTSDFILNGFNGYIVPPDDPTAVYNLVTNLIHLEDLEGKIIDNLSQAASDYAHENFGWDKIANNFLLAIDEGQRRGNELLNFRDWSLRR